MNIKLNKIILENFKSYNGRHEVDFSNISVLIGANSSGKSSVIQALLVLKQTIENTSSGWDLLLSGKYVTLGSFDEVINMGLESNDQFAIGIGLEDSFNNNEVLENNQTNVVWYFKKDSNYRASTCLHKVVIENGKNILELVYNSEKQFSVFTNSNEANYKVIIDGLGISKIAFMYNKDFNTIIIDYFNELLNIIYRTSKHTETIGKTQFAIKDGTDQLYMGMAKKYFEKKRQLSMKENKSNKKNSAEINRINSIKKETERFQSLTTKMLESLNSDYFRLQQENTFDFFSLLWISDYFEDASSLEQFSKLINKYEKLYKENIKLSQESNNYISIKFEDAKYLLENYKGTEIQAEYSLLLFYTNSIPEILKRINYVGPLRESPRGLYNYSFDTNPKYVGAKGELFPFVLSNSDIKEEYFLPIKSTEELDLSEALNDWCNHLGIASQVNVASKNSFGVSIEVLNMMNQKADIMNVGIGTSQVLPVLISGLVSNSQDLLIYEQPELHLHPYSQSRLADFFVEATRVGRQIIIESHSEYLLQRLRFWVLKGRISNDSIALNFFKNSYNGTEVENGQINIYGDIIYPTDFKDTTQELIRELLDAALQVNK